MQDYDTDHTNSYIIRELCDADNRRPATRYTLEEVIEMYIETLPVEPAVTKLVDPVDLYKWMIVQ